MLTFIRDKIRPKAGLLRIVIQSKINIKLSLMSYMTLIGTTLRIAVMTEISKIVSLLTKTMTITSSR